MNGPQTGSTRSNPNASFGHEAGGYAPSILSCVPLSKISWGTIPISNLGTAFAAAVTIAASLNWPQPTVPAVIVPAHEPGEFSLRQRLVRNDPRHHPRLNTGKADTATGSAPQCAASPAERVLSDTARSHARAALGRNLRRVDLGTGVRGGCHRQELVAAGHTIIATDLVDYGFGIPRVDFLKEIRPRARHIVTNPPYGSGLADAFITRSLDFVRDTRGTVAMLLNLASLAHRTRTRWWRERISRRVQRSHSPNWSPANRGAVSPANLRRARRNSISTTVSGK